MKKKWTVGLNGHISKENIQIASRLTEISDNHWEMQIKTIRYTQSLKWHLQGEKKIKISMRKKKGTNVH